MYWFYGKINRGQVSRPLFGGSVIRGFTVYTVTNSLRICHVNRCMFYACLMSVQKGIHAGEVLGHQCMHVDGFDK